MKVIIVGVKYSNIKAITLLNILVLVLLAVLLSLDTNILNISTETNIISKIGATIYIILRIEFAIL